MTSKVEIANIAFVYLGAELISDFSDDSREANAVNAIWDIMRKAELRSYPYNFATETVELARNTTTPLTRYDYSHALPSQLLRVWTVYDEDENIVSDFKIEGSNIVSNEDRLIIKYTKDITDTTKWDALFVNVMAYAVAKGLAYHLTSTGSMVERATNAYFNAVNEAKMANASEDIMDKLGDGTSTFINVRYF